MDRRFKLIGVVIGSLLLLANAGSVFTRQGSGDCGCSVINRSMPSIYITPEPSERTGKSITLVFHNNLSCAVTVEAQDPNPADARKLFKRKDSQKPDRTTKVEYVLDWSNDRVRLTLFYDFQNVEDHKAAEPANYWEDRHLVFTLAIPPGRSVIFSVEPVHLKKGFNISVPFYYPWERGPQLEPVVHRVYFASSDLPDSVRQ